MEAYQNRTWEWWMKGITYVVTFSRQNSVCFCAWVRRSPPHGALQSWGAGPRSLWVDYRGWIHTCPAPLTLTKCKARLNSLGRLEHLGAVLKSFLLCIHLKYSSWKYNLLKTWNGNLFINCTSFFKLMGVSVDESGLITT